MKKLFKIIIIVFAVLLIGAAVFALLTFGDVLSYTATGVEIRAPMGVLVGKALVVYNPGLSGGAKDAASKIANGLKSNGYQITFAGIRSTAAADTSGYDIIVVGGPIYAGKPLASVQGYLNSLNPPVNSTVGVFGIGNGPAESTDQHVVANEVAPLPSDSTVTLKTVMKIATSENLDARCSEFVTSLLH